MNKTPIAHLLHADAARAVPSTVDLWPAIQGEAEAVLLARRRHGPVSLPASRRVVIVGGAVAVLALGLGATTPAVQASVHALGEYFGVRLVDRPPIQMGRSAPPGVTGPSHVTAQRVQYLPLIEAQSHVALPIRVPAWMPPGFTLAGVAVEGATQVRVQYYGPTDRGASVAQRAVGITETQGHPPEDYVFLPDNAQDVRVAGQAALYVHGAWKPDLGGWDSQADVDTVAWQAGDVTYMLQSDGAGLRREDLLRIAASLRQ